MTPMTSVESATLKMGHQPRSNMSVTLPKKRRSIRLPRSPARMSA
uniref:MMGP6 n=1 Tax=uncultured organism TaxID=155900 RepID=G9HQ35_9ZZZZ|nr:MMGP6 [uncultured organism]